MRKLKWIFMTLFVFIFIVITINDIITFASVKQLSENTESRSQDDFMLDSFLFTHEDNNTIYHQTINDFTNFTERIANNEIALFTNQETASIRVLNKKTGHYWTSDIYDLEAYDFNNTINKRLKSGFQVTYRNKDKNNIVNVFASDNEVKLVETVTSSNTIHYEITLTKAEISFAYDLTINNQKLNLKLDYKSIHENGNKLTSIIFFPYLGATYQLNVPGYLFIPSGNGALIRLDQEPLITTTYMVDFYGSDANFTRNTEEEVLSLPIYGFVQGVNQNACLIEIKDGASFANFTYSPSNIGQLFNYAYPTFNYRETYSLTIPGSDSILMIPNDFYQNNLEIEYTFLANEEANYVGFVKSYQQELVNRGILTKNNSTSTDISLQIEAFGREYERGLIFKKYYNMTTTKDILDINDYLNTKQINNIFYSLRAFNKGGYSNQSVKNIAYDRKLGRLNDLKNLETYLYYNPIESYNYKNTAPNNVLVNMYNEKNYIKQEDDKYKFYANINMVKKYTEKILNKYDNIAFDGLGYRLYGDKNNKYTRTDVLNIYTNILGNKKLPMYTPNYYFLKNTSKYLNMPLYHDRLRFITDSVPFLQMLLKGYIDYYSPYLNFSSNLELDILKCIEYGANPAYLISNKQSYLLNDTLASNYYATYFESSKDHIIDEYKEINNVLKQVINATIINREVLTDGVYKITYSNNKIIIVNYTNDNYIYQGNPIKSMGYMVM